MKKLLQLTIGAALLALTTTGCIATRVRPGHSIVDLGGGASAIAVQSQDPKEATTQNVVTSSSDERTIPAGSVVDIVVPGSTAVQHVTLSAPMPVKHSDSKSIQTEVGAAQKNTVADLAAKLASVRWLQIVGVILALFGVAALFWPPLATIVGSPHTAIACIVAGGALIFLPIVVVGHELLILGIAFASLAIWYVATHLSSVTTELSTLKNFLDKSSPPASPSVASPTVTTTTTTPPPNPAK